MSATQVSQSLEVILKCLEKDPAKRYQTKRLSAFGPAPHGTPLPLSQVL